VVCQFVISICLIAGTITILSQLNYIQNKHLGFDKEQRIIVPLRTKQAQEAYKAFRNDIAAKDGITSVAGTSSYPGKFYAFDANFIPEGKRQDEATNSKINVVEPGLVETMGYHIVAGRSFAAGRYEADKDQSILINEASAQHMGWTPEEAIGKRIRSNWAGKDWNPQIIGVLKDFNYESLHQTIKPMVFVTMEPEWFSYAVINAKTTNWPNLLNDVEQSWKKYNASLPFEYVFLKEEVQTQYEADRRLSKTIAYLTAIAILISCMGLYGLAAFTAEQRTKEIGVRKVLGASVATITAMLSADFLKLVLLGNLIAWPIAWYGMSKWLENFAYSIEINIGIFLMAGIAAVAVALFTVSFQSIKAALANPINSLRSE
jgi:putative ABC transport system permease protein